MSGGGAQRQDLGVSRRVTAAADLVVRLAEDASARGDDGAEGKIAVDGRGSTRKLDSARQVRLVDRGESAVCHAAG